MIWVDTEAVLKSSWTVASSSGLSYLRQTHKLRCKNVDSCEQEDLYAAYNVTP